MQMNESKRKANGVTMKVLFVLQTSSRALRVSGTATTGCVWRRTICVTATTTVLTEVTSFLRIAPATKTSHKLCHSFRLFETEGCVPSLCEAVWPSGKALGW